MTKIKHVVLIDDDKTTNFLNTYLMLKSKRFQKIDTFENGLDALQKFADDPTFEPDAIFLDIDMPAINGWQVLAQFEKLYASRVKTRIFILTDAILTDPQSKFVPKCYVPEYLIKPLNMSLIEAIYKKYFASLHQLDQKLLS